MNTTSTLTSISLGSTPTHIDLYKYAIQSLERKSIWYMGKNIPDLIDDFDFSKYMLTKVNSIENLTSQLSIEGEKPEALLIESDLLSQLNAHKFSGLRGSGRLAAIPVIVLSDKERKKPNRTQAFYLGVDGCFSSRVSFNDLLFKINFHQKIESHPLKSYPNFKYKVEDDTFTWKRAFDILVSGASLLVLSPVLVLVALLVRLASKGPILYISQRAGKNYQIFNFYKFRTMEVDADKKLADLSSLNQYGAKDDQKVFFKIKNDPRVTRIGKFLRNTSLDELPQLVNILKGDMSIVGNRPLPLYEAETLTVDYSAERFLAPSGLTGLWQVKKRGTDHMTIEERITLDRIYARKWSMRLDLKLMFQTLAVFIQKESV